MIHTTSVVHYPSVVLRLLLEDFLKPDYLHITLLLGIPSNAEYSGLHITVAVEGRFESKVVRLPITVAVVCPFKAEYLRVTVVVWATLKAKYLLMICFVVYYMNG